MNRRASILLTMLIIITLALSLAINVFDKSNSSYSTVTEIQADYQGAIYAGTVLQIVESAMAMEDAEYDASDDAWAILPDMPVYGGFVTVTIRPVDDRLPINALENADANVAKRVQDAFNQVLTEQNYDLEIWRALHDWVAPIDAQKLSNVVENTVYNREHNSYSAKYAPLESLAEIQLLPETAGLYKELSALLCAGEETPRVNINFASAQTIKALMPEIANYADQIVAARQQEPFKKKDDLYLLLGSGNAGVYTTILPFFDVKSALFYVKIEVNILETQRFYHALYRRAGANMTLLRYIEGRNIDYF